MKRYQVKLTWVFVLISTVLVQSQWNLSQAALPETVVQIKKSVVSVATVMLTRTPRVIFYGTGFVVGDGRYVMTNDHVVPDKIKYDKNEALVIFTGEGSRPTPREAKLIMRDKIHDLALLRIKGPPLSTVTLGDSRTVREGERFAFTGFHWYGVGSISGNTREYCVWQTAYRNACTFIKAVNSRANQA